MFILEKYESFGTARPGYNFPRMSAYHGIPIQFLEVTKILMANIYPEYKYRVRYRGSRANDITRTKRQQQQDCTKAFATSFSIYPR